MAFSPWSALFADRVWNPNAFLVFAVLALLAAVKLRERPDSAWAAVLPVACLVLPHLHSSAPVVWLALVPLACGNRPPLEPALARARHRAWRRCSTSRSPSTRRRPASATRARSSPRRWAATRSTRPAMNLSFLLSPIYCLRFLTLDVTYHELSGYWGGLNEAAAWHALWHGSPARPFHPLRLLALLASGRCC